MESTRGGVNMEVTGSSARGLLAVLLSAVRKVASVRARPRPPAAAAAWGRWRALKISTEMTNDRTGSRCGSRTIGNKSLLPTKILD